MCYTFCALQCMNLPASEDSMNKTDKADKCVLKYIYIKTKKNFKILFGICSN